MASEETATAGPQITSAQWTQCVTCEYFHGQPPAAAGRRCAFRNPCNRPIGLLPAAALGGVQCCTPDSVGINLELDSREYATMGLSTEEVNKDS